jgi:hypothetical protein
MPSLAELFGGDHTPQAAPKQPEQPVTQSSQPQTEAMSFEYNFTLPLQLRRAELASSISKAQHLSARTRLWKALSFAVAITPILTFIAFLVK